MWYNLVNSLTLIKWWLEQDHIGLEQVHGIMGDNMRQGIFQAFHNYVWEKDTDIRRGGEPRRMFCEKPEIPGPGAGDCLDWGRMI